MYFSGTTVDFGSENVSKRLKTFQNVSKSFFNGLKRHKGINVIKEIKIQETFRDAEQMFYQTKPNWYLQNQTKPNWFRKNQIKPKKTKPSITIVIEIE